MLRTRTPARLALSCAALCSLAAPALADGVLHTSVAHFQQNIRADYILEPFNGPDTASLPAPIQVSGNGYVYSVAPSSGMQTFLRLASAGIAPSSNTPALQFTFTGKPVSAFGGTFRILNTSLVPVAGTINIQTNTGFNVNLLLNAGPAFYAFTTTEPFTSLTIQTVPVGDPTEAVDDVYVGTSGAAAAAADFCPDASTVGLGAYPFTTVGAGRYLNTNSCNNEVGSPDVYFRFMPPATGLATVDTCGCSFDSILRVFSSCVTGEIACNDDACSTSTGFNTASRVSFRVTAGMPVIVRIAGYNGASGSGTLTIAEHADCAPDFNHSGGLEVQDIFDFLSGWFAGCP
jgi:hypothetical protein